MIDSSNTLPSDMHKQYKTLVLLISFSLFGCAPSDAEKTKAQVAIKATLNDPNSVQFRDLVQYKGSIVCGEFNSKNSQGGFGEFKSFAFTDAGIVADPNMVFGLCKNRDNTLSKESRISEAASYVNAKAAEAAAKELQMAEAKAKREAEMAAVEAELEKLQGQLNKISVKRAGLSSQWTISTYLVGIPKIEDQQRIALANIDLKTEEAKVRARIAALEKAIRSIK